MPGAARHRRRRDPRRRRQRQPGDLATDRRRCGQFRGQRLDRRGRQRRHRAGALRQHPFPDRHRNPERRSKPCRGGPSRPEGDGGIARRAARARNRNGSNARNAAKFDRGSFFVSAMAATTLIQSRRSVCRIWGTPIRGLLERGRTGVQPTGALVHRALAAEIGPEGRQAGCAGRCGRH